MEFLNKVEIKGIVGNVTSGAVNDNFYVQFSVVTEYSYTNPLGQAIVEMTWWNCKRWLESRAKEQAVINLKKGDAVHLTGRLHIHKYVEEGFNGFHYDAQCNEVIVQSLEILQ